MKKCQQPTSGLASVGVYARGKFRGNLKVCRPSEFLRSPARTPSRQPLAATLASDSATRKKFNVKQHNNVLTVQMKQDLLIQP